MRKNVFAILMGLLLFWGESLFAQEKATFVNEGVFHVSSNEVVSVEGDFFNKEEANFKTDGTIYYQGNFVNDNLFYSSPNVTTAKVVFTPNDTKKDKQFISGNGVIEFNDVVFDSPKSNKEAFAVLNDISIQGNVDFKSGIVKVDSLHGGGITFLEKSKWSNASDKSYIDGRVEKEGREEFVFPVGNKGKFRYSKITAPQGLKDVFQSAYTLKDAAFFKARTAKSSVIETLNTNEYWLVEAIDNTKSSVVVTLSWADTTLEKVLENPAETLHVVRWDTAKQMWVDEGGIVDLDSKEVSTISTVKGYGFFTLASIKKEILDDGDIVIYNFVNSGGEYNEYFRILNINKFPNNTVEIFNRWGSLVYRTTNYDSNNNVFRGYSEGKGTTSKNEALPSGTYYYLLKYEVPTATGSEVIKKSGYLHLESN
ncbi:MULTISPECIES: gliding motility-associated C-terminal domain-containing protein [Myroides]|uniref:Gliding motility-associated C-terminal domain-containing protein n=1 Tax=Myroides albus TaxID=2562892 RepID=A0A6I3LPY4_9FLAO|nr:MULTISPECIES: gliding motility-associated C-terminal domain-containing protein [Myroides]MTG98711.1 gliding motility-associated C-terminal domain-containing protein [Myroides albus]MVX35661.1 gliding motility-associated C-terminal domain-containing protein [Myroides sp. LoEW2-1]UVD78792.1 gliding motility-associated C-terminal domain-containing protein [Myroides albus]